MISDWSFLYLFFYFNLSSIIFFSSVSSLDTVSLNSSSQKVESSYALAALWYTPLVQVTSSISLCLMWTSSDASLNGNDCWSSSLSCDLEVWYASMCMYIQCRSLAGYYTNLLPLQCMSQCKVLHLGLWEILNLLKYATMLEMPPSLSLENVQFYFKFFWERLMDRYKILFIVYST